MSRLRGADLLEKARQINQDPLVGTFARHARTVFGLDVERYTSSVDCGHLAGQRHCIADRGCLEVTQIVPAADYPAQTEPMSALLSAIHIPAAP